MRNQHPTIAYWLCAAAFLIVWPSVSDASRGRYDRLYVVPAPDSVTIDGDLSEWDRSAEIEFYVVPETRGSQTAFFSMMHDDEAVYLGGVIRDSSPMMNRHEPEASGNKGWDADAIQFRMVVDADAGYPLEENQFIYGNLRHEDGSRYTKAERQAADTRDDVVHLTMWHYTDEERPALQMHYGFTYRVPRDEWGTHGIVPDDLFDAKYRKLEDGGGYTFEYRIPWSTLGAEKPLKGGDEVAGTVQVNWSRPDGLATAGGAAWAYDVLSRPGFPFQSGEVWGKLIFTEEGNVPRDLVDAGLPPEKPLPLEFTFDMPVDGEATVQLLDQQNNMVRTLIAQGARNGGTSVEKWDGMSDSGEALQPGEYRWVGNYTDQPIELKWRFSVHNSGNPPYPTEDNKGGWGGDHGTPTTALHIPGTKELLLAWNYAEYGWGIIRVNEKGRKKWGSPHSATHLATDGKRFFAIDQSGFHAAPGVKVFDAKDSRPLSFAGAPHAMLEETGDEAKDKLTGLAYADGKLYVSYADRDLVAVFDAEDASELRTVAIDEPTHMAAGPDGAIYAVSGDSVMKLPAGGESFTRFADEHLDAPQGLAVHQDGRVLVANRGELSNVSVFNPDGQYIESIGRDGGRNRLGEYQPDGMLALDGITLDSRGRLWVAENTDAPKRISVWTVEDGENVDEFFGGSSYFGYCIIDPARPDEIYAHNVLWKIDWDNYTTEPVSTIWRKFDPNAMLSFNPDGYQGNMRVFTHENGLQFAYGGANNASVLAYRKDNIFQPFMAVFNVRRGQYGYGREQFAILKNQEKYPNGTYFWQDQNDDGIVDGAEVKPIDNPRLRPDIQDYDRKTMQVWFSNGHIMKPVAWENDRPVYDATIEETFLREHRDIFWGYTWLDPDGSIYTFSPGGGKHLTWTKWSPEGEVLINYPGIERWQAALGLPVIKPGRLWATTGPLGVAGEFTGNATYLGMSHVFDRDGYYVAGLGYDSRVGGDPSITGQPEGQGGAMVLLDIDGEERYFLLQGGQDSRVMEIMNLDTTKPLSGGSYVLSPEDVATARQAWREYEETVRGGSTLTIGKSRASLDDAERVGKQFEGDRGFEAALSHGETHLYARFDVNSNAPLVNAQADPKLIFKGGNLLDIQLATDPQADPEREEPAAGDIRLLVSKDPQGNTKAMLYQPKIEGFDGERTVLKSPTGEEPFDAITDVSDKVELEVTSTNKGFTAYVTVPLDVIGFDPEPGETIKADLGYIFGNPQGTQAMMRAYWVNNGFSANVVDDIPNESRLTPGEWGEATIE